MIPAPSSVPARIAGWRPHCGEQLGEAPALDDRELVQEDLARDELLHERERRRAGLEPIFARANSSRVAAAARVHVQQPRVLE